MTENNKAFDNANENVQQENNNLENDADEKENKNEENLNAEGIIFSNYILKILK